VVRPLRPVERDRDRDFGALFAVPLRLVLDFRPRVFETLRPEVSIFIVIKKKKDFKWMIQDNG